jgi:hypothetical protein
VARREITVRAAQDVVQWLIGAVIITNEALVRHGEPRVAVFVAGGVLMGIPGILGLWNARPGAAEPSPSSSHTTDSASSSQSSS